MDDENAMLEFDVSHFPNGIYLYDVRFESEHKTLRFIKK
jgi:hypothetical protein